MLLSIHRAVSPAARQFTDAQRDRFMSTFRTTSSKDIEEMVARMRKRLEGVQPGESKVFYWEDTPEVMHVNYDRLTCFEIINPAVAQFLKEGWKVDYIDDWGYCTCEVRFLVFHRPVAA